MHVGSVPHETRRYSQKHLVRQPMRHSWRISRRFERQEAEDQLSNLENEQRLKAQQEENQKHLPKAKDPMEEMEDALVT